MKKLIYSLLVLVMATFTFSSCEDVPAPYNLPTSGSSDTPEDPNEKGGENNPYTCAEAAALISAGNIPSGDVCVKGIISQIQRYDASHKSITYYISDDGKATTLQVYSGKGLNGADFTAETDLQVGWTVVVKGPLKDFNGQAEMNYDNQILSIDKTSTPDTPVTPDDPNKEVAIDTDNKTTTLTNTKATAGTEEVTFDANDIKDLEDAAEVSSFTLSDGTTITFGAGANEKSKPVFKKVATGNTIRVYKNNTITFNGKAAIAKVIIYFDEYNGTQYSGNATATIAVDGNKLVYTNYDPAATGGGTQLRIKSIKIIYAK